MATQFLAVKQLSVYKQATTTDERELVVDTLAGYLEEESVREDATFSVIAAQIYMEEGNFKQSLQLVHSSNPSLDQLPSLSLSLAQFGTRHALPQAMDASANIFASPSGGFSPKMSFKNARNRRR